MHLFYTEVLCRNVCRGQDEYCQLLLLHSEQWLLLRIHYVIYSPTVQQDLKSSGDSMPLHDFYPRYCHISVTSGTVTLVSHYMLVLWISGTIVHYTVHYTSHMMSCVGMKYTPSVNLLTNSASAVYVCKRGRK